MKKAESKEFGGIIYEKEGLKYSRNSTEYGHSKLFVNCFLRASHSRCEIG
jgi:hypothetical protein